MICATGAFQPSACPSPSMMSFSDTTPAKRSILVNDGRRVDLLLQGTLRRRGDDMCFREQVIGRSHDIACAKVPRTSRRTFATAAIRRPPIELGPSHDAIAAGQLGGSQRIVGLLHKIFLTEDSRALLWQCRSLRSCEAHVNRRPRALLAATSAGVARSRCRRWLRRCLAIGRRILRRRIGKRCRRAECDSVATGRRSSISASSPAACP